MDITITPGAASSNCSNPNVQVSGAEVSGHANGTAYDAATTTTPAATTSSPASGAGAMKAGFAGVVVAFAGVLALGL